MLGIEQPQERILLRSVGLQTEAHAVPTRIRRDGAGVRFRDGQRLAVAAQRDGLLIVDQAYGRGLAAPQMEIAGMFNLEEGRDFAARRKSWSPALSTVIRGRVER